MPDEAVDHVARASIEAHRATCEQIYKLHDERFINNSLDHKEIKHTMKELAREARKRWWWLLTASAGGDCVATNTVAKNGGALGTSVQGVSNLTWNPEGTVYGAQEG